MKRGNRIFILTLLLVGFGIVMIGNSSFTDAMTDFGDKWHFVRLQAIWGALGVTAMLISSRFSLKKLETLCQLFLYVNFGLLILVLVPGIGNKIQGARRWLGFGGFGFQPAELVKLTLTVYLAKLLSTADFNIKKFLFIMGGILTLVMLEPDMGTTIIILLISATMYFGSGKSLTPMILIIPLTGLIFGSLIIFSPYRLNRLKSYLDFQRDAQGSSYHIRQALLGIGSGGIWGVGFGQSKQKYQFLPEVTTDSIFAVYAEETGFVGSVILIGVFGWLVYQGLAVAQSAKNNFAGLMALGMISWVGWQFVINVAAMTALFPLTGVPLPFISYGGSSLVVLLCAMGLLINVSRNS